jgi:hypothetical protein
MSETTEEKAIEAFNMDNAAKALRAKLQNAFVELIPEEQWEALLKEEFEKFLKPYTEKSQYGRSYDKEVPSKLSQVCNEILTNMFKERLKHELASPDWFEPWVSEPAKDGMTPIAHMVFVYLNQNKEELIEAAFARFIGNAVQAAVKHIRENPIPEPY